MRVQVVDPAAFTPPYDHALCAGLARAGAEVELITSRFAYGDAPSPDGYRVRELFYRHAIGPPGSALRSLSKLAAHPGEMARYRRIARDADVVHFQWLPVQWLDLYLLPERPLVLTAHDLLPREPRPGQARAQRRLYERVDAVVVHSEYGRRALSKLGVDPHKIEVIHHGAFTDLASGPTGALPPELAAPAGPGVLCFGLLRPYKGIAALLDAWRELERSGRVGGGDGPQLWIVGRPRMPMGELRRAAGDSVRFVLRFVSEDELRALFRRAEVVVLPYARTGRFDQSGVLATALGFGKAIVLTDVGGFSELAPQKAALLVPPDDPGALASAIGSLLEDARARERLQRAAQAAASSTYSWQRAAEQTLALYRRVLGAHG